MLNVFRQYLGSKKAVAFLSGLLLIVAQQLGLPLSDEATMRISGILIAYIVGQGFADIGKEEAKERMKPTA